VISQQLYRRAEQILIEDEVATMPLYFNSPRFLVSSRVKGWYNKAWGGQQIRNWSLED
jgi:ABC-type oligopeptide transport system substrate-binding subunit